MRGFFEPIEPQLTVPLITSLNENEDELNNLSGFSGSKESLDNSSCGSNERESNSGLHSLMNLLNTNDSIPQKSPRPQKFLAPTSFPSHHEGEVFLDFLKLVEAL